MQSRGEQPQAIAETEGVDGVFFGPALAQQYLDAGTLFVAVGVDTTLLVKAASGLVQRFGAGTAAKSPSSSGGY